MATRRSDIAKAMYATSKEIFKKNLEARKEQEWKSFMTVKTSDSMEEKYETIGNLKPAKEKLEGDPIQYGKISDGRTTTLKNKTWANGFEVSMEAKEDDKWRIVLDTEASELTRTIVDLKEENCADVWNNVQTNISADGKAYAANDHPLINTDGAVNDNLGTGVIDNSTTGFNTWDAMCQLFSGLHNHYGKRFISNPSAALMNSNRQTTVMALLNSQLKPFESSNTKNTIPVLKLIFGHLLDSLLVHFLDETIDSAVIQIRKGIVTGYDYDERSTFNYYFNIHERYVCGMINEGFGFCTCTGQ
jgi:hypothetical protein